MKIFPRLFLFLALLAPLSQLRAAVGADNPTGVFGIFNGNVTTGCSYDPYTGNVMRSIPDISVAGAVGSYGLALSRTYNSRNGAGLSYGVSGWRHSYEWSMDDSPITNIQNYPPSSYTVNFPDGRQEIFTYSASDPVCYRAGPGISERFQPIQPPNTMVAYLVLPDGGKIKFQATQQSQYDGELHQWSYWYTYVAQGIIDPYGQMTTFTYDGYGRLFQVTEPAGHYIQFFYTTSTGLVIDHVSDNDGRAVQYSYINRAFSPGTVIYAVLDHVVYYGDSTWTAHYKYQAPNNANNSNGIPLLSTCDDPMYPGPMKRIGYVYKTGTNGDGSAAAYGQILSENYYDGTTIGAAVTTLAITAANTRKETRADTHFRTFTYTSAKLTSATDFNAKSASQAYDTNGYISSVTDRNLHTTNFTCNALTGGLTQIQYPLTQGDTPGQTQRPTVNYTYGSPSCNDVNNRDQNNPYYVCTATDEGGHVTQFTRDTSKRVTRIDYPDFGYETFSYAGNTFGEVTSHRMTTGGTETFTYGATGLKLTYRDPYHATGNPSAWYQYDTYDRLYGVTDALGSGSGDVDHTTNYAYNLRGQLTLTTLPTDPVSPPTRHSILNTYNSNGDGTLVSVRNLLNLTTSYTYDDYRRVRSVTTPGHNTSLITSYYYDANGTGDNYTHTDSNVTYITLPSGNKTKAVYDANLRKTAVTVGFGTTDAATTSYGYDNVGNLTSVIAPNEQPNQPYYGKSTITAYDQRNRVMSVTDALQNPATFTYDTAGRKKIVTRANGQTITYDTFDAMNRVTQQTVKQSTTQNAVTKYTYYTPADGASAPVGLLKTMQDPHLVGIGSNYNYTYIYDLMGRKSRVTYPPDTNNYARTEFFTYDTAGRLYTFQNRIGNVQTFTYDSLNRMTNDSWNDNGLTPGVSFGYDPGNRLTSITNANATITRSYFYDNLLSRETTICADNVTRWVAYTYDSDNNRATILLYPSAGAAYSFSYNYTGRDQLKSLVDNTAQITTNFWYDPNGNLTARSPGNYTNTIYTYDALDRVTNLTHTLGAGIHPTFDYAYDSVGNRKWTKRDNANGDVFSYDYNDEVNAVLLNIPNPDTTSAGPQTIFYDINGNRTSFSAYGTPGTYTTNYLNQYSQRNSTLADYNWNGDMRTGFDASTYTYDAQNRLLTARTNSVTDTFTYDGLNRQVSRQVGTGSPIYYNVYDGWDLIGEYASGASTPTASYVFGAGGLLKNVITSVYYYHDASGSTSHLASSGSLLLESYLYDLQGTPTFYDSAGHQLPGGSNYGVRHLFTGQQWYSELGLYDLRNRYYSPDIGRFLQPDPIGFNGDATNLYRYCGNNPLKRTDPTGTLPTRAEMGDALDIGYHGGDGTGSVGFGLTGRDASDSTIFDNPYYTDTQVMTIGAMPDFRGWDHGGSPTYNYHDGVSYPYADASGRGTFQTVGAENLSPSQEAQQGTGTAGWDSSQQSAVVAGYSSWSFADGKEWAGVTFQNPDASWGYTIAFSNANTATRSWIGPTTINGVAATDIWHVHVFNGSNTLYFSSNDVYNATRINGNIYMANLDGVIRVHGPDPTAVPNSGITYPGTAVSGPGFGPFGSW